MEVLNLDVLRPDPKTVKIDGENVDVSFIPVGITFEVEDYFRKIQSLKLADIQNHPDDARRLYELTCELCGAFCAVQVPRLDAKWFAANLSADQVRAFVDVLRDALISSLKGVQRHPKNAKATKTSQ